MKFILTLGIGVGYFDFSFEGTTAAFVSSADGALLSSGTCEAEVDYVAPIVETTFTSVLGLFGEVVDLSLPDGCSFF